MQCEVCTYVTECVLNGVCVAKVERVVESVMIDDGYTPAEASDSRKETQSAPVKETPAMTENTAVLSVTDKIEMIDQAIREGRKVKFTYTNNHGSTRTHYVIPSHQWVYQDGRAKFKGINYGKALEFNVRSMVNMSLCEPMKSTKKYYYPGIWDLAGYCRSALEGKNIAEYLARGWSETPVILTQPVAA